MNKRKYHQYSHSKYIENFSIQEKNIYCLSKDYYNSLNNNKINLRNNNIYFNAIVDKDSIDTLISYIKFVKDNIYLLFNKNIYIHINSKGGYLKDIYKFIEFKNQLQYELISIVDNECVDVGIILASLFHYRIINSNAKIIINKYHNTNYWNYYKQCEDGEGNVDNFKYYLYNIFCNIIESKITDTKLIPYLNNGCNWDSKKYKKIGLVDEIV
jgi:ATP-dependent protease ClpP protease subunit